LPSLLDHLPFGRREREERLHREGRQLTRDLLQTENTACHGFIAGAWDGAQELLRNQEQQVIVLLGNSPVAIIITEKPYRELLHWNQLHPVCGHEKPADPETQPEGPNPLWKAADSSNLKT
jgi:hypothetical protein